MISSHQSHSINTILDPLSANLAQDAINLFCSSEHQGHMGRWEYESPLYKNDPAGGLMFWAELVKNPGYYYLTQADYELIIKVSDYISQQDSFFKTRHLIELGAGGIETIQHKTLPFIKSLKRLSSYIAIDCNIQFAKLAAKEIANNTSLKTKAIASDYTSIQTSMKNNEPAIYVMWGGSIGNLTGGLNHNPYDQLVDKISQISCSLQPKDFLFISFDTQNDPKIITQAYNELTNKGGILSPLYLLVRDGLATGDFDPRVWVHEPVWFPDVMQCAHTIFPMFDQTVKIGGHTIKIPAWRRFVSNNSYKFRPDVMIAAVQDAGLKAQVIQHGPMAMLIAEK